MTARIDDGFRDHPKFIDATCAAIGLWIGAIAYCCKHATDGVLPKAALPRLAPRETPKQRDAMVEELLDSGAWEQHSERTYYIHDFLDWNDSREDVRRRREAGRRGAMSRWDGDRYADRNANRNADRIANGTGPPTGPPSAPTYANGNAEPNANSNAKPIAVANALRSGSDPIRSDPNRSDPIRSRATHSEPHPAGPPDPAAAQPQPDDSSNRGESQSQSRTTAAAALEVVAAVGNGPRKRRP